MDTIITVPGRTELGGNHTDHQGGHVLAAAVNIFVKAEAETESGRIIKVNSEGFPNSQIYLDGLTAKNSEKGTAAALVRGVTEYLLNRGYKVGGFKVKVSSEIPVGSGLSSSAAFEILIGRIIGELYNNGKIPELELALAGRYAETNHFGKPCGLMDQCACANGGIIAIDFSQEIPAIERINADFKRLGYSLFITHTGGEHSNLTQEYADITVDMKAVAGAFGKTLLSQVDRDEFIASLPELRTKKKLGDRAVLRALHYFDEDRRAQALALALKKRDMAEYVEIMDESSRSSAELLQNSYPSSLPGFQGISLAIALGRRIHGRRGASRVHGGGFAGTVQALLPSEMAKRYKNEMERLFGPGRCMEIEIYNT